MTKPPILEDLKSEEAAVVLLLEAMGVDLDRPAVAVVTVEDAPCPALALAAAVEAAALARMSLAEVPEEMAPLAAGSSFGPAVPGRPLSLAGVFVGVLATCASEVRAAAVVVVVEVVAAPPAVLGRARSFFFSSWNFLR